MADVNLVLIIVTLQSLQRFLLFYTSQYHKPESNKINKMYTSLQMLKHYHSYF